MSKTDSKASPALGYLVVYNFVSLALWILVLFSIGILNFSNVEKTSIHLFIACTQSLAILEIFHAIAGIVKSSIGTTSIQISSRLLLSYILVFLYPQSQVVAFYLMILAWGITECIRYSHYLLILLNFSNAASKSIAWARYTFFFVLYPLGAASEVVLLWCSSNEVVEIQVIATTFKIIAGVYIPGFYMMYRHMIIQRRKFIKSEITSKQAKKAL